MKLPTGKKTDMSQTKAADKEMDKVRAMFEKEIERKIERNIHLITKLKSMENPPPYATSLL